MAARWGGTEDRPALFFDDASDFDAWLAEHYATETVLWMGLNKKHVGHGLTWADAVPVALRWGWIDSTSQRLDDRVRVDRPGQARQDPRAALHPAAGVVRRRAVDPAAALRRRAVVADPRGSGCGCGVRTPAEAAAGLTTAQVIRAGLRGNA